MAEKTYPTLAEAWASGRPYRFVPSDSNPAEKVRIEYVDEGEDD